MPDFEIEKAGIARGMVPVAGIDEAGRGPWAGPVVAAAVVLSPDTLPAGINDSKALTSVDRDRLYDAIVASGAAIGVGIADVARIDDMNILQASLWAMAEAVACLPKAPLLALVDGNRAPQLACQTRTIVAGDARCLSIAAASIVAKVTRDRVMTGLANEFPQYGFERHKGYGTPEHKDALERLGPTPHHRRSFRPVRLVIEAAAQRFSAPRSLD